MKRYMRHIYLIISFVAGFILSYPFNGLQVENSKEYRIYLQSKEAYYNYILKNGKYPTNIEYLPSEIRNEVGKKGYPLQYDSDRNILICWVRAPLGTKGNLINYLWPNISPVGLHIE